MYICCLRPFVTLCHVHCCNVRTQIIINVKYPEYLLTCVCGILLCQPIKPEESWILQCSSCGTSAGMAVSLVAIISIVIAAGAVNGQEMCRPNSPRTDCGTRVCYRVWTVWLISLSQKSNLQQALIDKRFAKFACLATRASG